MEENCFRERTRGINNQESKEKCMHTNDGRYGARTEIPLRADRSQGGHRSFSMTFVLSFFQGREVDDRVCRQRIVKGGDLVPV